MSGRVSGRVLSVNNVWLSFIILSSHAHATTDIYIYMINTKHPNLIHFPKTHFLKFPSLLNTYYYYSPHFIKLHL